VQALGLPLGIPLTQLCESIEPIINSAQTSKLNPLVTTEDHLLTITLERNGVNDLSFLPDIDMF
jgi:hypothetical protein